MEFAESPKEKVGGLAFEVIFKPASVEAVPIMKSFSPSKEISQEAIERKLKEAEERRMLCEVQRLAAAMKDRERAQEANQRLSDMSDSFAREALKKLAEKMEVTQENKTSQIKALQEKLREHALRVEEVRKVGDLYRQDLKERIDRKLETAGEKRDRKLHSIQERLRQHKTHIDKVIEASSKFSKDTEEKLIQKMETNLRNRDVYLSNLQQRLKDHDRRIHEVRKNKLNQSSSEESVGNVNDSTNDSMLDSICLDASGLACEGE